MYGQTPRVQPTADTGETTLAYSRSDIQAGKQVAANGTGITTISGTVTFPYQFPSVPAVVCTVNWNAAGGDPIIVQVDPATVTTTQFAYKLFRYNNSIFTNGVNYVLTVQWQAVQQT